MTTHEPFSDAALEAMLHRRAVRADPGDLREQAAAAIARTRPRSWWPFAGGSPIAVPAWRLTPVLLAVLLVALLASGLLVGGSVLRQLLFPPSPLMPTGVERVTPAGLTGIRAMVEDGRGTLWALGDGLVTRIDPASGDRRTWSLTDDISLSAWVTAPAQAGGVWVWSGERIKRFTGDGFAVSIAASGSPHALSEAPDGTLWALSGDEGLQRWTGAQWEREAEAMPLDDPDRMVAISREELWVTDNANVGHLADGHWTVYRNVSSSGYPGLIATPDGKVWIGPTETGLVRFEVDGPVAVDGPGGQAVEPLAVARDGSLWAAVTGTWTIARRSPAGAWTVYGRAEGVVGVPLALVATDEATLIATAEGMLGFEAGQWRLLWTDAEPGPSYVDALVGRSSSEAWAATPSGRVWHLADGAWTQAAVPTGVDELDAIAVDPDGSLWAGSLGQITVLGANGWTTVHRIPGDVNAVLDIAVAPDGTVWAGTPLGAIRISRIAGGFAVRSISCPIRAEMIAVAPDGTVWIGTSGFMALPSGLARISDGVCTLVDSRDVTSLDVDAEGGVIVATEGPSEFTSDATALASVERYADGRWTVLGSAASLSGSSRVAVTPSGEVWWAFAAPVADSPAAGDGGGLRRLDDGTWSQVVTGGHGWGPLSVSPDGTLWLGGPGGVYRIPSPVGP